MAFTTHGHQIPGTPLEFRPARWSFIRCGGPTSCPKCLNESLFANIELLDPRYSKAEEIVNKTELETVALVRKPFYVQAVQVTAANMETVAEWCGGSVGMTDRSRAKKLIKCVHVEVLRATADWQKEARVGDWVVRAGSGYKVYTDKALKDSFDLVAVEKENNKGHQVETEIIELVGANDCD